VRREVGAVCKLIDQHAESHDVAPFYAEHYRFVVTAFHLKPLQSTKFKHACDERCNRLRMWLASGDYDQARSWIEGVAISEPAKLAALAVEGVL
jgi:hypothetical protein